MAYTTLQVNGGWNGHATGPVIQMSDGSICFGSTDTSGRMNVGTWMAPQTNGGTGSLIAAKWVAHNLGGGAGDLHNLPVLCQCNAAGPNPGKLVIFINDYNNPTAQVSRARNGRSAWGAAVAVMTTAHANIGSALLQTNDANNVVFAFFTNTSGDANAGIWMIPSLDGGINWGTPLQLFFVAGAARCRARFTVSGNRVDVFVCDGDPGDSGNRNLYHLYIIQNDDGTRSYFKSDGTLIGHDAALPLGPSTTTLMWNGNQGGSLNTSGDVNDIAWNNGVLYVAFYHYAAGATPDQTHHTSRLGTLGGGSWSTEVVTDGGTYIPNGVPGTSHYISGGAVISRNTLSNGKPVMYFSRAYNGPGAGADPTDMRIDTTSYNGSSWPAPTTLASNSDINVYPQPVLYSTTDRIVWNGGTYTGPTTFSLDLRTYPTCTVRSSYVAQNKPTANLSWQAAYAGVYGVGVKGFWPYTETGGTTVRNYAPGGVDGTIHGTVSFLNGTYGPEIGGYEAHSSNITADPGSHVVTRPSSVVSFYTNAGTTNNSVPAVLSSSSTSAPHQQLSINNSATNATYGINRDDASASSNPNGTAATNDGHYLVQGSYKWDTQHDDLWVFKDDLSVFGQVGSTDTNTTGTTTVDSFTMGSYRANGSSSNYFTGNLSGQKRSENGAGDPFLDADDFLSGNFLLVRPDALGWLRPCGAASPYEEETEEIVYTA